MDQFYGVVASEVLHTKGYSDFVQKTDPTLSGLLRLALSELQTVRNSFGVIQTSSGRLAYRPSFDYRETRELTNLMILFNSGESPESFKPENYSGSPEHYHYSGLTKHKHCLGSAIIQIGCNYQNHQVTDKEKGRTANPTLWDGCFSNHEENHEYPALEDAKSCRANRPSLRGGVLNLQVTKSHSQKHIGKSNYETFVVHSSIHSNSVLPLAAFFTCRRRSISAAKAAIMNCDVLSSRFLNNSISSTTLCGTLACNFCDLELMFVVDIAESSLFHRRTACTESMAVGDSVQPSGASLAFFLCLRLISPCMAVTMNCPVVSPSSFTESIAFTTSCGARACTFCDLELIALLAITSSPLFLWITVYREINGIKLLTGSTVKSKVDYTLMCLMSKIAKLDSVTSTSRASIHNVTKAYTMEYSHSTQTRPEKKYLWRFLALNRSDMRAKPCRISVEAPTEHDARRVLAPFYILSLSARLSAQGVCNA